MERICLLREQILSINRNHHKMGDKYFPKDQLLQECRFRPEKNVITYGAPAGSKFFPFIVSPLEGI